MVERKKKSESAHGRLVYIHVHVREEDKHKATLHVAEGEEPQSCPTYTTTHTTNVREETEINVQQSEWTLWRGKREREAKILTTPKPLT